VKEHGIGILDHIARSGRDGIRLAAEQSNESKSEANSDADKQENEEQAFDILTLTDDLNQKIFELLSIEDLLSARSVCQKWFPVASNVLLVKRAKILHSASVLLGPTVSRFDYSRLVHELQQDQVLSKVPCKFFRLDSYNEELLPRQRVVILLVDSARSHHWINFYDQLSYRYCLGVSQPYKYLYFAVGQFFLFVIWRGFESLILIFLCLLDL
jgi:hypothetical protein